MELEAAERDDFVSKANKVLDDLNFGEKISCGDVDEVKEFMNDLSVEDSRCVVDFLIDEEVIAFD